MDKSINMLIKIIIFIYLLFALRISIFQIGLILHGYQANKFGFILTKDKTVKMTLKQPILICKLITKGIRAIILWPIDFLKQPKLLLKAYVMVDTKAIFELGYYYAKTSIFK